MPDTRDGAARRMTGSSSGDGATSGGGSVNFESQLLNRSNQVKRVRSVAGWRRTHKRSRQRKVHNHPSGVAEPSRADEHLAQTLKSALNVVDVRVLDHLIVAGPSVLSFAERGLI